MTVVPNSRAIPDSVSPASPCTTSVGPRSAWARSTDRSQGGSGWPRCSGFRRGSASEQRSAWPSPVEACPRRRPPVDDGLGRTRSDRDDDAGLGTATGSEAGDQHGSERDAEQADQCALTGHRSRRDRGQGRWPAAPGRGRAGWSARSGAAGRPVGSSTATRLGRRHERRARDVVGGQAQPALLLGGERGRRCDRGAAVLARGRCASPGAVRRQEIGTDHRGGQHRCRERDPISDREAAASGAVGRAPLVAHRPRIAEAVRTDGRRGARVVARWKRKIPATTYFPERLPSQYLRRWRA